MAPPHPPKYVTGNADVSITLFCLQLELDHLNLDLMHNIIILTLTNCILLHLV